VTADRIAELEAEAASLRERLEGAWLRERNALAAVEVRERGLQSAEAEVATLRSERDRLRDENGQQREGLSLLRADLNDARNQLERCAEDARELAAERDRALSRVKFVEREYASAEGKRARLAGVLNPTQDELRDLWTHARKLKMDGVQRVLEWLRWRAERAAPESDAPAGPALPKLGAPGCTCPMSRLMYHSEACPALAPATPPDGPAPAEGSGK
jgi:chromosome segregation ATPase